MNFMKNINIIPGFKRLIQKKINKQVKSRDPDQIYVASRLDLFLRDFLYSFFTLKRSLSSLVWLL